MENDSNFFRESKDIKIGSCYDEIEMRDKNGSCKNLNRR